MSPKENDFKKANQFLKDRNSPRAMNVASCSVASLQDTDRNLRFDHNQLQMSTPGPWKFCSKSETDLRVFRFNKANKDIFV